MSSIWNHNLSISLFGESHGPGVGVVLDNLPAGCPIDLEAVAAFQKRRAPGRMPWTTPRSESDQAEILSGLYQGKTTGAPLTAVIRSADTRSADYDRHLQLPRPGHADWPGHLRYGGHNDPRGSGHFSGRLTAPLVWAGAIASQILARRGVRVYAHLAAVGGISDRLFDPLGPDHLQAADRQQMLDDLEALATRDLPVLDTTRGQAMIDTILAAREAEDSVGGLIEAMILGLPAGLGDPIFAGLEPQLASLILSIPAMRGIEFGAGFAAANMRGSEHNDPWIVRNGRIVTATNHSGGVIGGISTGMPVLFRVAVKPPASISRSQRTVDITTRQEADLQVVGRHDPCIAPRAVPVIEAAAALFALDAMLDAGFDRGSCADMPGSGAEGSTP